MSGTTIGNKVRTKHKKEKKSNSQNKLQTVKMIIKVSWWKNKVTKRDCKRTRVKLTKHKNRNTKRRKTHKILMKRKEKDQKTPSSNLITKL